MKRDLVETITAMQGKKILVVGDMVADIYLNGQIARISREAPVLVLDYQGEKVVAGGAANVVNNLATLGGQVFALGVLGDDHGAGGLREILAGNGADVTGLITAPQRPTISKTRVVAGGRATVSQQIVRIDRETKEPIGTAEEEKLLARIKELLPKAQGVVLSDYGSGTITEKIKNELITGAKRRRLPSIVDSRYDIMRFKGVSFVKQNDAELSAAVGRTFNNAEDIYDAGQELLTNMGAEGVLVTRGEQGMTLLEKDGAIHHIPVADKSEVFDVSGAGDTCVATMILALAAGVEPVAAAELSNIAAGIAVRKLGTATVSQEELRRAVCR
ncbi:MAG: carbohydrate kinase [Selenomonadaceae bacterium]|nr:carbohydrate kinase [Selenomonadaceae bacterium]